MHVLVTGATGFVGQALCARLHSAGHQVSVVSRSPEKAKQRLSSVVGAISWEQLAEPGALGGIDTVVHLAGETVTGRWTAAKHERVRQSRIRTTGAVVSAILAADSPPTVLVSASGIGFYGDGAEQVLTEESPPGDDFFSRLCVDWEAEALRATDAGTRVVLARLGIVLGVGGGAVGAMLRPARLGLNGPLGTGEQWWSWIHLRDVVDALCHLLRTSSVHGPVNLVAPAPVRQRDFAAALGVALGAPSVLPAPAFALRLVLGTFAEEVLSSKRVHPAALLEAGYQHVHPGLGAALSSVLGAPKRPSAWLPAIAAATLGMAPFGLGMTLSEYEPHILGKLRWVLGGAVGMAPSDWLDLMMHAAPWVWLSWVIAYRLGAAWTRRQWAGSS
jgi:uncharacterized protein (TIGR01777 family)